MNTSTNIDNELALNMLKSVIAAHDSECLFWERESVEFSRQQYQKNWGRIPSIEEVIAAIGDDRANQMIPQIIEWRKFNRSLKAKNDPCHICGNIENLKHHEFGLMRVESSKRDWGLTVATAAISVVSLPLAAGGVVYLPGKTNSGTLLRLHLVTCDVCLRKNENFLGLFFVKEKHAMYHPLWKTLQDAGFNKYIPPAELTKDVLGYMQL
jgi:hypothetical protein